MALQSTRLVPLIAAASLLVALAGCTSTANEPDSASSATAESVETIAIPDPGPGTIATAVFDGAESSGETLAPADGDVVYEVIRQCSATDPSIQVVYHLFVDDKEIAATSATCDGSIGIEALEPFADGATVSLTTDVPEGVTASYVYVDPEFTE